jgi:hypothetical protein
LRSFGKLSNWSSSSGNLFSEDDSWSAGFNEPVPFRPEVALVFKAKFFPCIRERLAGTTSGPDWPVVGPSGKSECVTPDPNPREEMTLGVSGEISRPNIVN